MDDQETRGNEVPVASHWEDLLSLYHEFKVCRFSIIVTIISAVVFLRVPQGVELLRSLGEESTFHVLHSGPSAVVKWTCLIIGAITWSLASWYTSRVLLYFGFSSTSVDGTAPGPWWTWLGSRIRTHLPRFFGVAPMLIMALGFWHASTTYGEGSDDALWWLRAYGVSCLLIALGLGLLFIYRPVAGKAPGFERRKGNKRALRDLEGSSRKALFAMAIISSLLAVIFTVNPIRFGGEMGASAVLLFAAASCVFWGSAAVYIAAAYRVPLLSLVVIWAAFWSLWNDNHVVRTSAPSGFKRQKLEEAFDAWHKNIATYDREPIHPLFIVATEGGGIRAAYWTATVLGELEDRSANARTPDFAEHVFAISAVSGGSLGAAAFDAALAGDHAGAITPMLQQMLGEDFLAPPLAALLYPDLFQRLLPFPVAALDRGQWLERAWEEGGRRYLGNDRFAQNFNDLWDHAGAHTAYLPALFLNGTSVETGQRIIASNVVIDQRFLDSTDAAEKAGVGDRSNCDVPLSTAAHGSARFTYVSPAGRFRNGSHIVDGGYFENSGSTTALEILRGVEDTMEKEGIKDVRPFIIFISNDPLGAPSGGRDFKHPTPSVKLDYNAHQPGSFLEDALAPVWALLNTRDAHNSYGQLALQEAQNYQDVFYFGLSPSLIPLPLGWKLSGTAANEMRRQVRFSGAAIDGKDNPEVFKEIGNLLNGTTVIRGIEPPHSKDSAK